MSETRASRLRGFSVEGQRAVVVGAALSGQAAARLLAARGATVVLTDLRAEIKDADALRAQGIRLELGGHRRATFEAADLVVLSPGVPPSQPDVCAARESGVPVIGEIELASRWLLGRIVAVTGTKGKSTTTTLIGRMAAEGNLPVLVGGNIGAPLSSQVAGTGADVVHVIEVSSFQLEMTDRFHPDIAVWLNLSPDHLDRHASLEEYRAAKLRIFANQTGEDWAVLNADDTEVSTAAGSVRARRFWFGLGSGPIPGVTVAADHVVARGSDGETPLVPLDAVRLIGRHLLSDVLAATAVGRLLGLGPDPLTRAVAGFTGLEHALEPAGEIQGVRFVNDSKATNVASARQAIESFAPGLVLIAGGRFKGGSFDELAAPLAKRNAAVVAIGEARPLIHAALDGRVSVVDAASMGEAVRRAFALASPGSTVLLAPACASFDMFRDYAERGRAFKQEVAALVREVRAQGEQ